MICFKRKSGFFERIDGLVKFYPHPYKKPKEAGALSI